MQGDDILRTKNNGVNGAPLVCIEPQDDDVNNNPLSETNPDIPYSHCRSAGFLSCRCFNLGHPP